MVIVYICGGLGNQMFQYAAARRLAQHRGVELKLDLAEFSKGTDQRPAGFEAFSRVIGLHKLSISAAEATAAEIAARRDPYSKRTTLARIVRRIRRVKPGFLWPESHYREKQYRFDTAVMDLPGNTYLEGFWQSPKYFQEVGDLIRAEFAPKDPAIIPYAKKYVENLKSAGDPVVSLHVRRGDLARAQELNQAGLVHGNPVSLQYISAAIARFPAPCRFLVFSDSAADIDWCKQNIRAERLHFSEGHTDIQDMAIMSQCDHHIIANSTFSWWAAWLDAKPGVRVVSPKTWSNPQAALKMVTDDLIPPGWEML
jgi:hypothetical protein